MIRKIVLISMAFLLTLTQVWVNEPNISFALEKQATKKYTKQTPAKKEATNPKQEAQRFIISKNGVVITDTTTGLQWAQDAGSETMTWDEANTYVKKLKIGGYSDWRLPNKEELESLVNYAESRGVKEYLNNLFNKIGFKNVQSDFYWSSTSGADHTNGADGAWVVGMWSGGMYAYYKSINYFYVWPVRSGQ